MAIAGSLAAKKKIATTAGTLSTTNAMFVFLLIVIVQVFQSFGNWATKRSDRRIS